MESQTVKKPLFAPKPSINPSSRTERPVNLVSNLLQMWFKPEEGIANQYSIKIVPEVAADNYPLRRKIYKQISEKLRENYKPYFPSGYTLFSSKKEGVQKIEMKTNVESVDYKIEIEKTKNTIDLSQIRTTSDENIKVKSFIEILVKNIIEKNNNLVRFDDRSFFNYYNIKKLQGNSYIMPGFSTAAVITESGLYLRVNDKNKFMNGKTAYEKLQEIHTKFTNGNFSQEAKDYFANTSVLAKYGSYRVYRINDITFDKTPENTTIPVKNKDGLSVTQSLVNYYKIQYGIDIKDKSQPLLIHKPKGRENEVVYLVPELCYLTGMDEDMKDSDGLRRSMVSRTKTNANEKMENISKIKDLLFNKEKKKGYKKNATLAPNDIRHEWGIEFKHFCNAKGRELLPPDITFEGNYTTKPQRGRFRQSKVKKSIDFLKNEWVCVTSRESKDTARSMIESLKRASGNLGIRIESPDIIAINARHKDDFVNELRTYDEIRSKKIVFVVLDRYTKGYYSSIKQFLYNQLGIPSQCVSADKRSQNLSYYSNVLNQMVVKARGELYYILLHDNLSRCPAMIVGIDSSKIGKDKTKIVVTSSYSASYSTFFTQQEKTENSEYKNKLRDMIRRSIDYFVKKSKVKPLLVFIYRAGGNEKQKEKFLSDELPIFKSLFGGNDDGYQKGYTAKICFFSVNKKTDLKFFQEKDRHNYSNPDNGTVVDTDVVHPDHFEFYLQPQFVNQGTATPVHYHVLYDDTKIPIEALENITYKQTYYYWNWPGPIREPAALKFAEVCNSFTARYMNNEFSQDELRDTPFYI